MRHWLLMGCFLLLGGCAADSYLGARATVVQNKFDYMTCDQVVAGIKATEKQVADLEKLMAKASEETVGNVIGMAAYGPTLVEAKGNLRIYRETHAAKNCPPRS